MYGYGVVVEEVEEVCVQMVCGARTSPDPPFLKAVLVITRSEGEDCDNSECQGGGQYTRSYT